MSTSNKQKKTTVTPGIIGGGGLSGAKPNAIADQIRLNNAKTEENTHVKAEAEAKALELAKAEEDSKAEAKALELAKAEENAKAEAKALERAKAEENAKAEAKALERAKAQQDAKAKDNVNDAINTEEQIDFESDESKKTIKRNVIYRFAGMVNEGRTTQSSFTICPKLYSELRVVLINNERKLSYKDFHTITSLAMVHDLIDIEKLMRDLYKKNLIKLKELK